MAHPYAAHRQTAKEHSRVGHITKGYATGGAVKHSDEAEDRKLIRSMVKKADLKADGGKAKHRMDKPHRAKGGRVGKGKNNSRTIVNVITGGHPAAGALPPGPPMAASPPMGIAPAGAATPPMAARPPMPGPGMMAPGGPPGGPPMPMRAKGGRVRRDNGGVVESPGDLKARKEDIAAVRRRDNVENVAPASVARKSDWPEMSRAKGGRVHKPHGSPVFNESVREGTQVQHDPGKNDLKDMGRGRQITFKAGGAVKSFRAYGGRVESSDKVAKATMLPGGSGGGEARLAKAHRAERKG